MFIYQIDKKEEESGIILTYYSYNDKKETISSKNTLKYLIYMKKDDFETLNVESDNIVLAKEYFLNKNKEKVVKIEIKSKELFNFITKSIRDEEFDTYEMDFPSEHRELLENLTISKEKSQVLPKILSLDIETIGEKDLQKIVLISTQSETDTEMNKVYAAAEFLPKDKLKEVKENKFKGFELVLCDTEKDLLIALQKDIQDYSPQMIVGWNVIDFDFVVIKQRMKEHSLTFTFSKIEGIAKMRIAKGFFGKSSLTFPGMLVIDGIHLLKTNFITFEDYKLNTVAKEVLSDEKIDLEEDEVNDSSASITNKIKAIEQLLESNPIKLIEYNFKDSVLVSKILTKLRVMELMLTRSTLTNTPFQKIQSPIATLDIMYLKELHKKGIVAKSNFNFSQSQPIEGAFVLDPKSGYYENVFVLDFKSLYPSIIMTFNIDPFTCTESGQIKAPNGAHFDSKPGILPQIISILGKKRDEAKKNENWTESESIKVTMNSFYGAMASNKSRYHNRDVAEAITSFGRKIILETNDFLEKQNMNIVYNDTDSTFMTSNKIFKSEKERDLFGLEIEKKINSHFEEWTQKNNAITNSLSIEFEKLFTSFFIATKKRYVGFDSMSKSLKFTGLEAIRNDWTQFAREFQVKLVKKIFSKANEKELKEFIFKTVEELKSGKYDPQLIYHRRITKPLAEYTKTTPPHVRAARELKEFEGKVVEYAMTMDGPKHKLLLGKNPKYDYDHYVDKQLGGVSEDLLSHLNMNFKDIIASKKQKSLKDFW